MTLWFTLAMLLAALAALAILQYNWIGQITNAEQARMRAGLTEGAQQFRIALNKDMTRATNAFQIPALRPRRPLEPALLERAAEWSRSHAPADWIRHVYLVRSGARGEWQAQVFEASPEGLTPQPWPSGWPRFRQELTEYVEHLDTASAREWHRRPWLLDSGSALLFRAAIAAPEDDQDDEFAGHELLGFVVLELNREFLSKDYFPELVLHSFGPPATLGYKIAVLGGPASDDIFYESEPNASRGIRSAPDIAESLLQFPSFEERPRLRGVPPILPADSDPGWRILAQHRSGSLVSAAAQLRRRNLAVSLGVFAILLSSLAFLLISARRARELARSQVDFVAGVSHELRTPVAAVCMVAENLADGIVETPEQARQYGRLLRQQGRRLATMVEQTLTFASLERNGARYTLRSTPVGEVVAQALSEERPLIDAAGISVDSQLPADLPPVMADPAALKQCMGNLLSNAVKYASAGGYIGLRAESEDGQVRIVVRDRGPGIDPRDRDRLFDPFYRGEAAREAQIYGNGLGLSLVKRMVEAMGGRITVESEAGNGSAFTLHLRTAA